MSTVVLFLCLFLIGCTSNADGAGFDDTPQSSVPSGRARIVVFRPKLFYVTQASNVVSADIRIDGNLIGDLKNGGYLTAVMPAGERALTAQSSDKTEKFFNAPAGETTYIEVYDKSRMEADGATIAGGISSFFSKNNAYEGKIWGMDGIAQPEALDQLKGLSLSLSDDQQIEKLN